MALLDVRDLKISILRYHATDRSSKRHLLFPGRRRDAWHCRGIRFRQNPDGALHSAPFKENSAVSGGEILYEDSSVAHASSQDLQRIRGKEISMIFQEPMTSLNPVLTIEEQIAEGLLIHESCTPAERHEKVLAINA